MPDVRRPGRRRRHHHDRGPRRTRRHAASDPAGDDGCARVPVRVLLAGLPDECRRAPRRESRPDHCRDQRGTERQPLPLHRLPVDRRGGRARGRGHEGEAHDEHEHERPRRPERHAGRGRAPADRQRPLCRRPRARGRPARGVPAQPARPRPDRVDRCGRGASGTRGDRRVHGCRHRATHARLPAADDVAGPLHAGVLLAQRRAGAPRRRPRGARDRRLAPPRRGRARTHRDRLRAARRDLVHRRSVPARATAVVGEGRQQRRLRPQRPLRRCRRGVRRGRPGRHRTVVVPTSVEPADGDPGFGDRDRRRHRPAHDPQRHAVEPHAAVGHGRADRQGNGAGVAQAAGLEQGAPRRVRCRGEAIRRREQRQPQRPGQRRREETSSSATSRCRSTWPASASV